MADTKVSAFTTLTGANSAPTDLVPIIDVSDTSQGAGGTAKIITRQEFQTYSAGTLTTDVKVLDLSATWNNAAVVFTGLKFNATLTAMDAGSMLADFQLGASTSVKLLASGGVTVTDRGYSQYAFTANGHSNAFRADTVGFAITSGGPKLKAANYLSWSSTANWYDALDLGVSRIAAGVLGVGNGSAGSFSGRLKLTSTITAGVTVANLNASPTVGEEQVVTDASAVTAKGATVAAGGSSVAKVMWNGTNWVGV